MPSGGARSRSGPAPDPNALKHGDGADWVTLPIDGREGPAPKITIPSPTAREKTLWVELWKLPQATMWEQLNLEREVGLYVRKQCEAECKEAPAALVNVVVRLADSLGLNTAGMHRNKWKIGVPKVAEEASTERSSTRDRLTLVSAEGA